ncbi:cytochrome c biogenesis CcdA family protein [Georgenia wangjunii]|uniref:cytochrome c biogenesis CcdA family protein n=1 Tax=Georgenia wangjunii TaxID=3117730 RepID=UPI002F26A159
MSFDALAETFRATVLSGPLLAALPVALVAGAVSFASPCVLPLVPGYVGYLGGMSGDLGAKGARGGAEAASGASRRLLWGVLLFVAGFSAVFVLLGVVFGWLGVALAPWVDTITRVLGVVVILMGLAFMGAVPFLQRERRLRLSPRAGLWGAPVLGVVFGLGWAPCIGPTLSAVLLLSLDGGDPVRGGILALAYCLGLGLPFVLIALAYARSTRTVGFLRRHRVAIMRVGGAMLVLLGLALVTGVWGVFAGWVQGLVAGFVTVV